MFAPYFADESGEASPVEPHSSATLSNNNNNSSSSSGTGAAGGVLQRNGFKRPRGGHIDLEASHLLPLSQALARCPLLENLELGIVTEEEEAKPG